MNTDAATAADDPFEAVGYDDHLPVAWTPGGAPTGPALDRLNAELARSLSALAVIEEAGVDPAEESEPVTHEVLRLESKVDLLLSLVGRLMLDRIELPDAADLTLRAGGVEWLSPPPDLAAGDEGLVTIYVNPDIPLPLRLPGRVLRADGGHAAVVFEGLIAEVGDHLSKYVFRHHRRQIARAREQR